MSLHGLGVLACLMLMPACGEARHSKPAVRPKPTDSLPTESGPVTPEGGDAGDPQQPDLSPEVTPFSACARYVRAMCLRQEQCGWEVPNCERQVTKSCPDSLLPPDSGMTPAELAACAEGWAALPCEQMGALAVPSCRKSGLRANGESCQYFAQCASWLCDGASSTSCGTCVATAGLGESCSDALRCAPWQTCELGVCVPSMSPRVQFVEEGGVCTGGGRCVAGLHCRGELDEDLKPVGEWHCLPPLKTGAYCRDAWSQCAPTDYCSFRFYTCEPRSDLGGPCDEKPPYSVYGKCLEHLECDRESLKCIPPSERGEPCGNGCAQGLVCRSDHPDGDTCVLEADDGEPCAGDYECREKLVCREQICVYEAPAIEEMCPR